MTTKYWQSLDKSAQYQHLYLDSGKSEILHINVTEPLLNLLTRAEFEAATHLGKTETSPEEFIRLRNYILRRMDLI